MISKFNNICRKLFFESISFKDLPQNPYEFYGFWLSPGGNLHLVKDNQDHMFTAKKIILNSNQLTQKFIIEKKFDADSPYITKKLQETNASYFEDTLFNFGYLRIAKETFPTRAFYFSGEVAPTNKQINMLKDLGMMYDMSVINDDGKVIYQS